VRERRARRAGELLGEQILRHTRPEERAGIGPHAAEDPRACVLNALDQLEELTVLLGERSAPRDRTMDRHQRAGILHVARAQLVLTSPLR
jgi:hypothetical protein